MSTASLFTRFSRAAQPRHLSSLCFTLGIVLAPIALNAQAPYLRNVDFAVGGTGQFTRELPDQNTGITQGTTEAAGALLSFRDHPYTWAGVEINYQYTHLYETYSSSGMPEAKTPIKLHETTAAYLIESHARGFEPFVAVGGGALFLQSPSSATLRPTGLLIAGVDIPTANPHFGFRLQGRGLLYQAPKVTVSTAEKNRWLATIEPSLSVYMRF